jgi:hypothetical protein
LSLFVFPEQVAAANMYFNPAMQQQFSRSNPALYWPGLQGLVTNPLAWRDRLGAAHSESTKYFVSLSLEKCPRASRMCTTFILNASVY